jgi:TolB-like protein
MESLPKGKLAVMDLKAKHGVKESLAEGLSVVVRDAIQGLGDYEVLSKDDVEVVAKRTAIRQSLGCDDTQCLIDIGRSLGSRFMVAGAVSKFGDTYNVSLRLIDTVGKDAGVKKRINRDCKCAEDELIEAARVTANLLLE